MKRIAQYITKLRTNDDSLTELNLNSQDLNLEEVKAFAIAIAKNNQLRAFDFSNNFIGTAGVHLIGQALERNESLKTIYLRSNDAYDGGAVAIANALKVNKHLKAIFLGNNNIESAGVAAIAKVLSYNCDLELLSLRNNEIGDEGCRSLSYALIDNASIRTLNLANTGISDESVKSLTDALQIAINVTDVNINYNDNIEEESNIAALKKALQYNNSHNVVSINKIAKKILVYCEEHLEQEAMGDMRLISREEMSKKYALAKEDLYYISSRNIHGGAILCVAALYRILTNKYEKDEVSKIMHAAASLCGMLFSCFKEEMTGQRDCKPNDNLVNLALEAMKIIESE